MSISSEYLPAQSRELARELAALIEEQQSLINRMNQACKSALLCSQFELMRDVDSTDLHLGRTYMAPIIRHESRKIAHQYDRDRDLYFDTMSETPSRMDEHHFACLLRELVDNAFRYSSQDSPIRVTWLNLDSDHRLIIRDEGKGMSDAYVNALNVGGPLSRLSISGLHIVKKIVELYDAHLSVLSKEGHGTAFEVDFPDSPNRFYN